MVTIDYQLDGTSDHLDNDPLSMPVGVILIIAIEAEKRAHCGLA